MKKISQVIDTINKMKPQQGMGGEQVTPEVAAMQRPAAQARAQARNVVKLRGGRGVRPPKC